MRDWSCQTCELGFFLFEFGNLRRNCRCWLICRHLSSFICRHSSACGHRCFSLAEIYSTTGKRLKKQSFPARGHKRGDPRGVNRRSAINDFLMIFRFWRPGTYPHIINRRVLWIDQWRRGARLTVCSGSRRCRLCVD